MLIDTHSHIYDEVFDGDRDAVVARAREAGVGRILLPAVDGHSYGAMFETARRYAGYCFPMMGLHPTSVNDNPRYRDDLERVARLLEAPPDGIRFCGVGEVGLDLYWSRDFADEQLEALRFQIELALRYGLPLVIHTRDAWPLLAASMPPAEPRHDMTVAVFDRPPSRISSQPMIFRPFPFRNFSMRCTK